MNRFIPALAILTLAACAGKYQNFEPFVNEFTYQSLAFSPVNATAQGFMRFASDNLTELLDEFGPNAQERQRQFNRRFKAGMEKEVFLDRLHPLDRADYDLIQNQIALNLLDLDVLKSAENSPTLYVETIGNALFPLYAVEYDKEPKHRFFHITRRMELIPRFLAQAKANLKQAPVAQTRVAKAENDGNIALIDDTLRKACPAALRPAFDKAAGPALKALTEFNAYLENDLIKRDLPWQLGADKYGKKFALVLGNDRSPAQVLADAEAELKKVQAEMQAIAGTQTIRQALDRVAQNHGTRDDYFANAERDLKEATDFVRAKGLVTLGNTGNLKVIPTPEFMRGIYGVGGFNPAPALRPELGAFYWLTPIPAEWPKERVESKLREYNRFGLKLLTIHEAMPGHYVQFEWANQIQPRGRRLLRSLYGSGAYVEGWAVYITQVMLEEGYLDHDPGLKLTFLKQQLRMIGNAILDIRFHTQGWSDEEAMRFMLEETYQEKEEAVAKLQRAKLGACQLPTYFVGWQQFNRLRDKMKSQPWYSLKEFHERTLRLGALPVPLIERLLLAGEGAKSSQ